MGSLRFLAILLLTVPGFRSGAAEPDTSLAGILDRAVAGGFPEVRGAELLRGSVRVRLPRDRWSQVALPGIRPQDSPDAPDGMVGELAGCHLRCRDGHWILAGGWVVPPDGLVAVEAITLQKIAWDELAEPLVTQEPPRFERLREAEAERVRLAWRPASAWRGFAEEDETAGMVMAGIMLRMGVAAGEDLAVVMASRMALDPWRSQAWEGGFPLMLDGLEPVFIGWETRVRAELPQVDLATARWLARCLSSRLESSMLIRPPAQRAGVARGAVSILAATDQPRSRAATFLASTSLADRPAAQDLRSTLANWDGQRPAPKIANPSDLIALLDDDGPSLHWDHLRFWTVGDQALLLLGWTLGRDPRLPAGVDPQQAWDAKARHDAARAIRRWIGTRSLPDLVREPVATRSLSEAVARWSAMPVSLRPAAFAASVGSRLPALAVSSDDTPALARLLDLLETDPDSAKAADAVLGKIPVKGPAAPLLAEWNDRCGRPESLDLLLEQLADPRAWDPATGPLLIGMAAAHPNARRLPVLARLLGTLNPGQVTAWQMSVAVPPQARRQLLMTLLDATGTIPSGLLEMKDEEVNLGGSRLARTPGLAAFPAGTRWCDLAIVLARTEPAAWGLPESLDLLADAGALPVTESLRQRLRLVLAGP